MQILNPPDFSIIRGIKGVRYFFYSMFWELKTPLISIGRPPKKYRIPLILPQESVQGMAAN